MPIVKKILFISCSSGSGHTRAADALLEQTRRFHPEIYAEHIDLANFSSFLISAPATIGYSYIVRHAPKFFKLLYNITDSPTNAKNIARLGPLVRLNAGRLLNFIDKFKPDRIICTHFLVAPLLKKYYEKIPIDMVVTDYYANKIWLCPFVRTYFVADEYTKKSLGGRNENIVVSGMPIHPNFLRKKNTKKIKTRLGLNNNLKTVLLLAGGQGLADTSRTAKEILENFTKINLVAISGKNNQNTYDKLKKLKRTGPGHYKVLKFTKQIDEWMCVSDMIITKPGGMTVAESLYLLKPLLLISPIPGQEIKNAEFVEKNKMGKLINKKEKITTHLSNILAEVDAQNNNYFTTPGNEIIINYT